MKVFQSYSLKSRHDHGTGRKRRRLGQSLTRPARYGALACGALPVLAFPAPNLEFLAWCGLVPGLLLMRASGSAREAAARGWWFGAGFMLAAHYWLAPSIGPGLLLAAIVIGALWIGVGVSAWALLRPPMTSSRTAAALVVVPSYWLVVEWVRSWQALGGPWALLGASQWQHPTLLALAAVGGVWLMSFAIVAANTAAVVILAAPRPALRLLGAAAGMVMVVAGPVAFAALPAPHATGSVRVALVQPGLLNGPQPRLAANERLTAALTSHHPDLVVWGESSVSFTLADDHALLGRIEALSAHTRAQVLADQDSYTAKGKAKLAVLVGPHGIVATYTKTRLVPFGEYIPFRQQLGWLTSISRAAQVNMVPGRGARVMTVTMPDGRPFKVGVLICFEAAFPDMSRADTLHGARMVIYQTSDSTFQDTWAPAQHASLAAVRAAETGRPVVQAALTGVTAAFDAQGRLLAWLGTSHRGAVVVRAGLVPSSFLTPFDRLGAFVAWITLGVATISAGFGWKAARKQRVKAGIMMVGNRQPGVSVSISERVTPRGCEPTAPDSGTGAAPPSTAGAEPPAR
ncbi:MAG TPA: apolipoprotein N-acyltransferase [Streptosporangiaceae bacterium]|nr:apolipoprotein N-acyltransferase [Streptosporangiaceae bacterium]